MPKALANPNVAVGEEIVEDDNIFLDPILFGDPDEKLETKQDNPEIDPLEEDLEGGDDEDNLEDALEDLEGKTDDKSDEEDLIALSDGIEVPLKDVEAAYTERNEILTQRDEVKADRVVVNDYAVELKTRNSHLETQVNNLVSFLQKVIPAEADRGLISTDIQAYTQAKEHREAVLAEISQVMQIKQNVDAQTANISVDDINRAAVAEKALLIKAQPNLRDEKRLVAFETAVTKTAKDFGFTDAEIANIPDHRIKLTLHYAAIGKKAIHNRANAKLRVTKANANRPNSRRNDGALLAKNIDKQRQEYQKTGSMAAAEAITLAAFS